jgi:creatinine amidohydrolase
MDKDRKYLYSKLTWPEINDSVKKEKVVLIPFGMLEDHGYHLPVDTDILIATTICEKTAEMCPEEILVIPPISYGYSPHHIDFPGPITITWDTLIKFLLDICKSLIYHGFKKILVVNGHGSNGPIGELATRLAVVESSQNVHCAFISWWELTGVRDIFNKIRGSKISAHAGELETSLYLAINPENVYMEKAETDMSYQMSTHFWSDLTGRKPEKNFKNPLHLTEFWSAVTKNGVKGDPTTATREKGLQVLKIACEELLELIKEFRAREIKNRVRHQI